MWLQFCDHLILLLIAGVQDSVLSWFGIFHAMSLWLPELNVAFLDNPCKSTKCITEQFYYIQQGGCGLSACLFVCLSAG